MEIDACDSATLRQLESLSSRQRAIEESINESSSITEAIAKICWSNARSPSYFGVQIRERALEVLSTDLVLLLSATTFRKAVGAYHQLALDVLLHVQPVWAPERPTKLLLRSPLLCASFVWFKAQAGVAVAAFYYYFYITFQVK